MEYSVKILGKLHKLPKYTLNVEKECKTIIESGTKYNSGNISAEELLSDEIDFLKSVIGDDAVNSLFGDTIGNMDINEVDSVCCDIVREYQRPAREKEQKELEERYAPVKKILAEKGMTAALNAVAKQNV